jgi:putative colanic acid biosynthesis UDP-glucose lipid carrier transferase
MFSNRFRGLVNLHTAAVLVFSMLLFWVYAHVERLLPFVPLGSGLSLTPYLVCVAVGVLFSASYLRHISGRYHELNWVDAVRLTTRQVLYMSAAIFAFMFAYKDRSMSRIFVGSYMAFAWVVLLNLNRRLPKMLSNLAFEQGHKAPTIFVGSRQGLTKLKSWTASRELLGLRPLGLVSDLEPPGRNENLPLLGGLADLPRLIDQMGASQVIVLEIPRTRVEGLFLLETCQEKGCRLLIYSNLAEQLRHPLVTVLEQGHQFYMLQEEPLEDPVNRIFKRMFDLAISVPVVVLLLPPLAILVWLAQLAQSRGRLFFLQTRTGYGQREFKIIKFRTMHEPRPAANREAEQAKRDDDRIYGIGNFLRRTSLDEIPQFLNVLRGEMSVVGPRPHMVAHDKKFSMSMKAYRTRFFAKPGITGLAQCNGLRGEITEPALLEQRVRFDITYVSEWSLLLDVQLVIKTFRVLFFPPKTAY